MSLLPATRPPALGAKLLGSDNAVNLLRLVFATAVVVSHAWPVGGFGTEPPTVKVSIGQLAVGGFFLLSGWLIVRSGERTSPPRFLWHRVLRIFPALWVNLALTAFVAAPIAYAHLHHSLDGFSRQTPSAAAYVTGNLGVYVHHYGIGDTLAKVPYAGVWNGSLHTLWQEIWCYLAVLLLATAGLLRNRWVVGLLTVGLYGLLLAQWFDHNLGLHVWVMREAEDTGYCLAFAVGALAHQHRHRIPWDWRLAVLTGVLAAITIPVPVAFITIGYAGFAYLVLWLAVALPGHRIGRANDVSYGVYIYAFPVQQLLAVYGVEHHGQLLYVLASLAATYVLAWLSWLGVEKPFLQLKGIQLTRP